VGYLRYEAASAFDAALQTHPADGPLAWFGVYAQALPWPDAPHDSPTHRGVPVAAQHMPTADDANTHISWHSRLTRVEFDAHMANIHQAIAAGEFYQVNYTAPLHGALSGSADVLFDRLQQAQPGGYAACIDSGFEQVLSVSPELFFDWDGSRILTRPMKGTAPRGSSPPEDAALALQLTQSPKERAENVMIVDLLRNDLSRIALPYSVKVPALFQVQSLPTVHQMVSDVTALTRPGTTLTDVFAALFPCGSITGAPKVRAMQMIRTLEPQPRGIYCGCIGVVRPGGHATFNVAIRSVTLKGVQASCGIGSGITADARAATEWQEWQHKRRFLERAAEPFNLLETLRLQNGEFHLLDLHLARLQRTARHFGHPFDETRIRHTLTALAATSQSPVDPPQAATGLCWRVRLQVDRHGTPQAEKFILTGLGACPPRRVELCRSGTPPRTLAIAFAARAPLLRNTLDCFTLNKPVGHTLIALAATPFEASDSEFSHHKTTRRAHYEAFAPADPAVFDTLLYNPRGELTECTRGNIAVLLDGQWLTPALHCGLLPGVGRAHWLQQGRLREAVITLSDLKRAQGVAFVNSLRGWLQVEFVLPPSH